MYTNNGCNCCIKDILNNLGGQWEVKTSILYTNPTSDLIDINTIWCFEKPKYTKGVDNCINYERALGRAIRYYNGDASTTSGATTSKSLHLYVATWDDVNGYFVINFINQDSSVENINYNGANCFYTNAYQGPIIIQDSSASGIETNVSYGDMLVATSEFRKKQHNCDSLDKPFSDEWKYIYDSIN